MEIDWTSFWAPLWRFLSVGLLGVGINFGTTWLLKERVRCPKYLANSLGFAIAVVVNYLLNRVWTFQSTDEGIAGQALRFAMVAAVGLVLNHGIVYFGHQKLKLGYYLSKVVAVGGVFVWNFTLHSLFTFSG